MGLSHNVSEINDDFGRKSYNFPTTCISRPPLTGIPLELGIGAKGQKTRMRGLPDGRKKFKIGLVFLTQYRRVTDIQPSSHLSTAKTTLTRCVARVKSWCWWMLRSNGACQSDECKHRMTPVDRLRSETMIHKYTKYRSYPSRLRSCASRNEIQAETA